MRGEGESDVVGCGQGGERIDCRVKDAAATTEGDVAQTERCGVVVRAGGALFAGAEEKEETKPNDVGKALIASITADVLAEDVVDDGGQERLDSSRWRVLSFVAAKLA